MYIFAADTAEQASGISGLGLDLKSFIFQLITFAIVVYVLNRFVLRKLFAVIDARRAELESGLKSAQEAKQALADADAKAAAILDEAHAESSDILATTNQEAASLVQEAEAKAAERAESLVKEAQAGIAQEVRVAREALKNETRQLVAQATEKIIHEKLDDRKDASLVDTALKAAGQKAEA